MGRNTFESKFNRNTSSRIGKLFLHSDYYFFAPTLINLSGSTKFCIYFLQKQAILLAY